MALLLAPTVPSEPKPQNLQLFVPAGVMSKTSPTAKDVAVTSSTIPIVKPFLGSVAFKFSNTATTSAG